MAIVAERGEYAAARREIRSQVQRIDNIHEPVFDEDADDLAVPPHVPDTRDPAPGDCRLGRRFFPGCDSRPLSRSSHMSDEAIAMPSGPPPLTGARRGKAVRLSLKSKGRYRTVPGRFGFSPSLVTRAGDSGLLSAADNSPEEP